MSDQAVHTWLSVQTIVSAGSKWQSWLSHVAPGFSQPPPGKGLIVHALGSQSSKGRQAMLAPFEHERGSHARRPSVHASTAI